jgi:hypothetical protein
MKPFAILNNHEKTIQFQEKFPKWILFFVRVDGSTKEKLSHSWGSWRTRVPNLHTMQTKDHKYQH